MQVTAQTMGLEYTLDDKLADEIAADASYRVRQLIQDALKFTSHSTRDCLSTADIDNALALRNIPPLFGYASPSDMHFSKVPGSGSQGIEHLYFLDTYELKFDEAIQSSSSVPIEPTLSVHWLAIEGVQPRIPQNPPAELLQALPEAPVPATEVVVKPLVRHVLSKEQQLYFEHVKTGVKASAEGTGDNKLLNAVLMSLSSDAGLHQLVPYLVHFVAEEVRANMSHVVLLTSLMKMTHAMLRSPHLHIEPYLHQLMPPILSCVVSKSLCAATVLDHWSLRDYAASLVALICRRYADAYPNLQPRISKTLTKAFLDPKRSLTTHYGAIVGLTVLGTHVVRLLILPNLKMYLKLIEPALSQSDDINLSLEAQRCYAALLVHTLICLPPNTNRT